MDDLAKKNKLSAEAIKKIAAALNKTWIQAAGLGNCDSLKGVCLFLKPHVDEGLWEAICANSQINLEVSGAEEDFFQALWALYSTNLKLSQESLIDPSTGLYNAKHCKTIILNELARMERWERPLTVALIQIVPPAAGKPKIGALLKEAGQVINEQKRRIDEAARYAEGVIALIMPDTGSSLGLNLAGFLKKRISGAPGLGKHKKTSVLIGLATAYPDLGLNYDDFILKAEKALAVSSLHQGLWAASSEADNLETPLKVTEKEALFAGFKNLSF